MGHDSDCGLFMNTGVHISLRHVLLSKCRVPINSDAIHLSSSETAGVPPSSRFGGICSSKGILITGNNKDDTQLTWRNAVILIYVEGRKINVRISRLQCLYVQCIITKVGVVCLIFVRRIGVVDFLRVSIGQRYSDHAIVHGTAISNIGFLCRRNREIVVRILQVKVTHAAVILAKHQLMK